MGGNQKIDEELKLCKGVGRHFVLREVVVIEKERERERERERDTVILPIKHPSNREISQIISSSYNSHRKG